MKNFVTVFVVVLSILFIASTPQANAQLTGTKTIPGDYATIAAAVTDLNSQGVGSGGVTFNVAADYTETISARIALTATGTASDPIIFQKSGAGANPKITSYTGGTATPSSATPDGIWSFSGSDYVTIDGIDLAENASNTTNPSTMEYGYGLFKASASDGAQNNTIKNSTVTLNRVNNASGTSPMVEGSVGILVINSTATAATTVLTPTDANGTNSNNKFYTNTIQNCNYGIALSGYAAATPFTLGDTGNDIGGTSSATGNTIINYGGGASTNPAAGVRANNQWSINISWNTINNNNGSGVNHATTLRGIYAQAGTSANATVNHNTVTVNSGATTSACTAIENVIGSTAASNTVNIVGNTVQNCTYSTATSGIMTGIVNSATAATVNIDSNSVTGCVLPGTGAFTGIDGGGPTNLNMRANNVYSNKKTGASGIMYCTRAGTSIVTFAYNNVYNDSIPSNSGTSASTIYGYYDASSPTGETYNNNNIHDLYMGGTSTSTSSVMRGIYTYSVSGSTKNIYNNNVYNLVSAVTGTGATTVIGIEHSAGTASIYKNKIYGLTSSNSSTTNAIVNGITCGVGSAAATTNAHIYNNLIGNLTAPNSGATDAIRGISILTTASSTTFNVFYNTVYINASSGGTNFGTTGIYHVTSATATTSALDLRNNIFANTSTPNGTGLTVAYRRSSTTLTNFSANSNNNDFYAGTPGSSRLIFYDGTNADQTLAAYKTRVSPRCSSALTENPTFISTTGSDGTFLHINTGTPTQTESGGTPITSPISVADDYDADSRNASTPDVGADEFAGTGLDLSAPNISYSTLSNTASTSNRAFTSVTITDASGVNTTAGTNPRVYYKKSTNANAWNDNTSGTDGWKYVEANGASSPFDFTIDYSKIFGGGGVTANDTVQYFVVAQDLAGTPNVGINSGTFAATPSSVDLTSAAFPLTGTINSYRILGFISGTKTVGASGADYTTLTAAVADLNANELNGTLTIFLNADYANAGETFPITINANPGSSATNTVTIKPASGATVTVSGSSSSSIIKINGADYVTIDGTNATVMPAATRDVTISNTSTSTNTAAIWVASLGTGAGSANVTIKNCNIMAGSNTVSSTFGVFAGGASISTSGTGDDNDNLTINNNSITKAYYGVYARASASGVNDALAVTQNSIGSSTASEYIGKYGLDVTQATGADISQNTVFNFIGTNSNPTGMLLGTGFVNSTISRNDIHSLRYTGTTGYAGKGIDINTGTATSNVTIANNIIYDLLGDGWNALTTDAAVGIRVLGSTGGLNIYYNSVNLTGNTDRSATATKSAALYLFSGTSNIDVRNNILANSIVNSLNAGAKAYAIVDSGTNAVFSTINYNDYYASGSQGVLGYISSADKATLGDWQTATGQDANSKAADPVFTSSTDVHINTSGSASPASNAGTTIAGITTDYDGDTRHVSTPDMGADEFTYPLPEAFTLTSPTGAGQGVSGTLTWGASTNAQTYDVYLDQNNPPTTLYASGVAGTSTGYSGLLPSTTYYWEVYAKNSIGDSLKSTNGPLSFQTVTPPADPTNLMLSNVTKDSIYLSWTDNADDGANQDSGFVVYRKAGSAPSVGGGSPDSVATVAAHAGTGTVNYQDYGLSPNVNYFYRVSARNANGESNFTEADTTTLAETPAAPIASNAGFTSMQLALADPSPNPVTTEFAIRVNYGAMQMTTKYVHTNGALVDTAVWGTYANFGSASGVTVTGLTMATSYTYDVKARNADNYETNFGATTMYSTLSPLSAFPYTQDFEGTGDEGWSSALVGGSVNNWVRGTPAKTQISGAHGGTKAWVTKTTGNYDNNHNAALYSPYFDFSALTVDPTILFWQNFKTEAGYDAGVLEYTTNGGTTWRRADSTLGTGGNFTTAKSYNWHNSSSTSGPVPPPKFSNTSTTYTGHAGGWVQSTTLLTGLAGQSVVQLRWRFQSETSGQAEGWAIDDIKIATDVTAPVITYTPLSHTQGTGARQLATVITGGVDMRAAGAPRVYYKKNAAGSYYAATATTVADTNFTFDIDPANIGTVSIGDTVMYYVAAQDSNGNAITNPAGSSYTTDPPNGSVSSPSFYIIVDAPLSGDYTVGTTLFNRITGRDITFEKRTRKVIVEVPDDQRTPEEIEATKYQDVKIPMKTIEVEEEYSVPMENGKEYTGELFTDDKQGITAGVYATITAAINDVVLRGVSGPVRFLLTDATYTGETLPITASAIAGTSAANTVTVMPNAGVAAAVTGSSASQIFKINGANHFVINGVNIGGSALTIENTNTSGSAIQFVNGSSNDTLKNLLIKSSSTSTAGGAIHFSTAGTSGNDNNHIEQCVITSGSTRVAYGIYGNGTGATPNTNNTISNCSIYDFSNTGIYLTAGMTNTTITRNTLYQTSGASGTTVQGVYLGNVNGTLISNNLIYGLTSTGTSPTLRGIYYFGASAAAITQTVQNNFIYLESSSTKTDATVRGIDAFPFAGNVFNVYYNSVYIGGTGVATGTTAAIAKRDECTMAANNNIAFNARSGGTGKHYAVYVNDITGTISFNNNDYYANGTSGVLGYWNTADRVTLTDWQTASSQDANSVSGDPLYLSGTNLHINNSAGMYSPAANIGASVAGITTDIDGDTRSAVTPDIGADEFTLPPPGSFALISPTGASQPVSVVLLWNKSAAATRYDVYVGTDNPPTTLVANNVADTQYTFNGSPSTTYYWQVYAETGDSGTSRTASSNGPLSFETVIAPSAPSDLALTTGLNTLAASVKNQIDNLKNQLKSGAVKDKKEYTAIEEQIESLNNQLLATAFVQATWTDNAADEANFYVYRKAGEPPTLGPPYTDRIAVVDANPGSGGQVTYNDTPVDLAAHYYYRVTAASAGAAESGFTEADTTTLAEPPVTPTFTNVEWSRMNIIVDPANNSSGAEYAILDSATGQYVDAGGVIGSATEVWQTYAQWGGASGVQITGLSRGTLYSFTVKARNGDGIETAFGPAGRQRTTYEQQAIVLNEGFESATFPPTDWQAVQNDGGAQNWERNTTNPNSGVGTAAVRYESSSLGNDDWLITPLVHVPTLGATLSFYYRAELSSYIDSFEVWMSPQANGSTPAQFLSGGTLLYNDTGNSFTTYQYKSIDMSSYAGQDIYLAWRYDGYDQYRLYIDDVLLAGKTPPNTITIKKLYDVDNNMETTDDRTPKNWNLSLHADSATGAEIASVGSDTALVVPNLLDGTYYAVEADSAAWTHVGYILNGTPTASSANAVPVTVTGGGQNATLTFINNIPLHTVTVLKWRDANSGILSRDEARTWFLTVRRDSCNGTIVASGNTDTLVVSNLLPGTYYVSEADSAGWEHDGYILDGGSDVYNESCVELVLSGGQSRLVELFNWHPNTITVRKFRDTDGGAPSFDAAMTWGLAIKDNEGDEIVSDNNSVLTLSNLVDGNYSVCEADSEFWAAVGYRIDSGTPVAGTDQCVSFSVADGQNITIDFANKLLDTTRFYSVIADSFALTKDAKGAIKSIKKKADKVQFTATVKPDSNNVNDLHLEFGVEIDTVRYEFTITPTPSSLTPDPKSKLKKWNATFSTMLDSNTIVTIAGYGSKGMKQKISSYWWTRNGTIVGKKKSKGAIVDYTLRLPMPNVHNLGEETFAQGAFPGKDGMIVGVPHLEAPNSYAWVIQKKYADVQKSLVKKIKTGYLIHDSTGRCFDLFKTGKFLVKKQTGLPPDKHDNKLFADLIALKINIGASALLKTPVGFGELKYSDAGHPLDGMMVKTIAANADTFLTNCTTIGGLDGVGFDSVIANINDAFRAPFDTLSWSTKLTMKPIVHLSDVPFLVRDPSIVPMTIVPLENEISQTPEKFELYQNYPNPFNPSTIISFDLPQLSKVTLKVYNLIGQEVMTLYDAVEMEEGSVEIELNAEHLSTGVYFYRLTAQSLDAEAAGVFTETKKLMLVK